MISNFKKAYSASGIEIKDLLSIHPNVFGDDRGFFFESWNQKEWEDILKINNQSPVNFVQDNHSKSSKGVLRGLHFQKAPNQEVKLVRCINGAIWDVIVDLRPDSMTFLQWYGTNLTSSNRYMLYIPKGFAHGFITLQEDCEVIYFHSGFYCPEDDRTLLWNDKDIGIQWPLKPNHLSDKDKNALTLKILSKDL